jgi:predicted nuclease with TOPRIM domain
MLGLRNYVAYANGTLPTTEELLACLALMQEEISRVREQAEKDVAEAAEALEEAYEEGHADGEKTSTHQVQQLEDRVEELEARNQELEATVEQLEGTVVELEGRVEELEVESGSLREENDRLSDRVRVAEDALAEDATIEREAITSEHYRTAWDYILSDDAS